LIVDPPTFVPWTTGYGDRRSFKNDGEKEKKRRPKVQIPAMTKTSHIGGSEMAGARDWVRKHLSEATARAIERVAGALFGDDNFIECSKCRTPVPANLVSEWGHCPVCKTASDHLPDAALLARRDSAIQKGEEARRELEETEQQMLDARHSRAQDHDSKPSNA
jgi:hypothetical protein